MGTFLKQTLLHCLPWVGIITVLECVLFNLPFWTSFSASSDSASYLNPIGSGLTRGADGSLTVTDPTQAYIDLKADGSSPYLRLETVRNGSGSTDGTTAEGTDAATTTPLQHSFHVRADVDGHAGGAVSVNADVPRSLYLKAGSGNRIRLWIGEAKGTHIDCSAARANVRVPFHLSWLRVAVMVLIGLLIEAWRPSSRLWHIRLDTHSRAQRAVFAGCAGLVGVAAIGLAASLIHGASPLSFTQRGNYTYDFDQYGHIADSLLHGRANLDLPVPDALRRAANPYDPATRERLLDQGVSPIYWDYVFFKGHWYSYFGIIPALLLFAPFRLITSAFIPGGVMLPSSAAVTLLLFVFALFGSLLVIRLVKRLAPHASLASVSMAIALVALGSNAGYLAFRMNFYSVPFAASLAVSAMGLWFWLGAADTGTGTTAKAARRHRHTITIGAAPALSWPQLCMGSLCIAANAGCRPTFTLVALLGFPIFLPQIKAMGSTLARYGRHLIARGGALASTATTGTACEAPSVSSTSAKSPASSSSRHAILKTLAAVLIPALVVTLPLACYNVIRFGSPLNFGDRYQLTVADMVHVHNPLDNLASTLGYYLFLPLRLTGRFPFLAINPTPLPHWSYTEAMVGGLFALCPALLVIVALPWTRRRIRRSGSMPMLVGMLVVAFALLVLDSRRGGLGWRYMVDFGWLVALAAIAPMLMLLGEMNDIKDPALTLDAKSPLSSVLGPSAAPLHHLPRLRDFVVHLLMALLFMASLAITALSWFTPGRDDALIRTAPTLFNEVQSWFTLL